MRKIIMNKSVYIQLLSITLVSFKSCLKYLLINPICSFAQYVEDLRCASWPPSSDRLIANRLTEIFQSFCLKVDFHNLSAHNPPKTRNCTNRRNRNQTGQEFFLVGGRGPIS